MSREPPHLDVPLSSLYQVRLISHHKNIPASGASPFSASVLTRGI